MFQYIKDLNFLCNTYNNIDELYIFEKYNIKINTFNIFFDNNKNKLLIFNSKKSEILFIYIININIKYIYNKYKLTQEQLLNKLFINKKKYYLNKCHKFYLNNNNEKMHLPYCNCTIKVKSISNINIDFIIKIINNQINKKNKNKKLIFSINKLNEIQKHLSTPNNNIIPQQQTIQKNNNINNIHFFQFDTEITNNNIHFQSISNNTIIENKSIDNNIEKSFENKSFENKIIVEKSFENKSIYDNI